MKTIAAVLGLASGRLEMVSTVHKCRDSLHWLGLEWRSLAGRGSDDSLEKVMRRHVQRLVTALAHDYRYIVINQHGSRTQGIFDIIVTAGTGTTAGFYGANQRDTVALITFDIKLVIGIG